MTQSFIFFGNAYSEHDAKGVRMSAAEMEISAEAIAI